MDRAEKTNNDLTHFKGMICEIIIETQSTAKHFFCVPLIKT